MNIKPRVLVPLTAAANANANANADVASIFRHVDEVETVDPLQTISVSQPVVYAGGVRFLDTIGPIRITENTTWAPR